MPALLSHSALLGLAKESTLGTYVAPTTYIPLLGSSGFEDMITSITDESYRNNDSMLQGWYQGVGHAEWQIDVMAYPDVIGPFLRSMIGPDTVFAGASTTLSASSSIGATSITVASATGITGTPPTIIQIGTGPSLEYAQVTSVTGTTLTVTTVAGSAVGLTKAHASSDPVVAQTVHIFQQTNASKPTFSLTLFDNVQTLGSTAASLTDLTIKIDPKAAVTFNTKWMSRLTSVQSPVTATYTTLPPELGYSWLMNTGGGFNTRGLTLDLNLKRSAEVIASSGGGISPREIFVGPLTADGTYKAIFDSHADMDLFINNSQQPVTAIVQQRVVDGGASLTLTMSQGAWTKGKRDFNPIYVQSDYSISGVRNTTDAGSVQATLINFATSAY